MKGTPMDEATYEYIVGLFARDERTRLADMAAPAQAAGLPMIMVSDDQAKFLRMFVSLLGARRILDVGTLFGYSAAVMAQALPSAGRVVSLELDPRHAKVAEANLKRLGLAGRVQVKVGPALEAMKRLRTGSFDLVLIDADKAGYIRYFEEAVRLVGPGGVVAADNALAWGKAADPRAAEPDVRHIRAFNEHVAKRSDVEATILTIGDGLLVARVLSRRRGR